MEGELIVWRKFKRFYCGEMYKIEANGAVIGGILALIAYGGFYLLRDIANMITCIIGG